MRHDSLYRLGGNAALLGGILGAVAISLHAPQPMDLATYSALAMGPWMAAHWLFVIAIVGVAGGLAAFTRHFAHTDGEGWSVLGFGAVVVSSALFVAIVAPEIVAFDAFRTMNADASNGGAAQHAAAHAYLAVNLNLMSLVHVAGPIFFVSLSAFGLAMLRDAAWPRWLGPAGVVIGLAMVVINFTVENFTIFKIAFAIGFLWLATAGFLFARLAGMKAGEQPGVAAPPDAYKPSAGVPVR